MNLESRLAAFAQLGRVLKPFGEGVEWEGYDQGLSQTDFARMEAAIISSRHHNGWFTPENVRSALLAISESLEPVKLERFAAPYREAIEQNRPPQTVAVIMAGNIPLVGFHDFLCVLLAGHDLVVKLSSDDKILLPQVAELLFQFAPDLAKKVTFEEGRLDKIEAVIATGSNNSSRYFEAYFGKYPNVIRKNRTSVAVIDEDATEDELTALGDDLFRYFGLGCRNVTKVYFPRGFDLDRFFGAIFPWQDIVNHQKYGNNYDYYKALYLMNQEEMLENGFLLIKEEEALNAPPGVLFYEYYDDQETLLSELNGKAEEIQCMVGRNLIPFGQAQHPELWDYADNVDTMKFLLSL